jgi:hypothetical protein
VQRLALLLLLVPIVAGAFVVRGILDGPSPLSSVLERAGQGGAPLLPTPAAAAQPTQRPTAAPAQPTPSPRPTPRVVPTATPSQSAGVRRRIVNTDGQGVALRASPGGPRLPGKGYDEGATVTLLGQDGAWAHIRGDDGREGWVLAVTLG